MKIKISEAQGLVLDYLVAVATGDAAALRFVGDEESGTTSLVFDHSSDPWSPTTNWAQGGPAIDQADIQWCRISGDIHAWCDFDYLHWRVDWNSSPLPPDGSGFGIGDTILVATMQAFVTSKLGPTAEVPDELLEAPPKSLTNPNSLTRQPGNSWRLEHGKD